MAKNIDALKDDPNADLKEVQLSTAELKSNLATAAQEIIDGNKEAKTAVAAEVTKMLSDLIEQQNLADLLLTREDFALNEVPKYHLDEELDAYIHAPGSWAPMTHPRKRELTFSGEMISAHIMLPLQELRSGRYGSIDDQLVKARRAILGKINKIVIDTFKAAVPSTSVYGNYISNSGATLDDANLNTAINYVEDQTEGARVIAGRRNKLYAALDFNTSSNGDLGIYDEQTKRSILQTGTFGTYRGLPLVGWKQYKTREGLDTLDNYSVWVVGADVGRAGYWEDLQSVDDVEVGTLNWHIHLWLNFGAAVFFPERIARIVMSA